MPRGQFKARCHNPIEPMHTWQPIKGRPLSESEKRSHIIHATSQTPHNFLSLFSYNQNPQNSEKSQEHEEQLLQTLIFQNQIQAQCSEIHHGSQRFITESSSPNHFPCNSSVNSPLKAANSTRSQREEWEEEGRKFKGFGPVKKKKRNHRFIFGIQAKKSTNRIKFKSSWRFQFESPNKTQVNT